MNSPNVAYEPNVIRATVQVDRTEVQRDAATGALKGVCACARA